MTAEEIARAFEEDGYVLVPDLIEGDELVALQEEMQAHVDAGPQEVDAGDYYSGPAADGTPVFFRVQSVMAKARMSDAALVALGHPLILEVLHRVYPDGYRCLADALLFKGREGGAEVAMHSAVSMEGFDRTSGEVLNVDIYLDEARPDNGGLLVLPGSHRWPPPAVVDALALGHDHPDLVPIVAGPGDVVIHSEFVIHGSRAVGPGDADRPLRRILYFGCYALEADDYPTDEATTALYLRRTHEAVERRVMRRGERFAGRLWPESWDAAVGRVGDDDLAALLGRSWEFAAGRTR